MRSVCAMLLALIAGSIVGCTAGTPGRSTAWFQTLPAFRGPVGPDVVQFEWALIERPVGDRYLNEDLWSLANEQVIPLERKDVLVDSGLRIAQIGGLLPSAFQDMMRAERYNPNPRRRQVRAGRVTTLALGPVIPICEFRAPGAADGQDTCGHLTNVQFSYAITPMLAGDDKVRLSFTPQIQHGETKTVIKPADDGSGWTCGEQAVSEKFGGLSWDVTLGPNEYLLVGCWFKSQQTYGKECFVRIDEPKPVQRLLVIRTSRQLTEPLSGGPAESLEETPTATAAHASNSMAHGNGR